MLVLSRTRDQTVVIGDDIEVTVVDIRGDKVRMGINAPRHVSVHRKEVYDQIKRENQTAAQIKPEDLTNLPASPPKHPRLVSDSPVVRENPPAFEPRLSLITLGVSDLKRSTDFYHNKLGFPLSSASSEHITFLKLSGIAIGLYPQPDLDKDIGHAVNC